MQPERHFLSPRKALGPQAAAWLLERAEPCGGCPDLGAWGVVVPTAESGRVLASLLTRLSPRRAVLLPSFFTPVQVLRGPDLVDSVATEPERLMAWCEALASLDFDHPGDRCEAVFPTIPPMQDFSWAHGVAQLFLQTQNTLMESGCALADVVRRVPHLRESDRWEVLGELENRYREVLRQWGLEDPLVGWQHLLEHPAWDNSVAHWALIGVPDPIPMVCRILERSSRPVHCVIHATEAGAPHFDAWGRPAISFWSRVHQPIEPAEKRLHLMVSETGLASTATALVRAHSGNSAVVLGICREEILPRIRQALEEDGVAVHDPSGHPAKAHEFPVLLAALQELLEERSLRSLRTLVTHPGGRRMLLGPDGETSPTPWLAALDEYEARHLARTLDDVLGLPDPPKKGPIIRLIHAADDWCKRITRPGGLESLKDGLLAAYSGQTLDDDTHQLIDLLDEWMGRASSLIPNMRHLQTAHLLRLWVDALSSQRVGQPRPPKAVELKGWLELAWDEHPHLVLCGVQEGAVPPALTGDVFLPESLRAELGLRTSADLLARDAFLLHGLLESRQEHGRVDVLLSKFTDAGEPLQPSRLLLQTPDQSLAARVHLLFGDAAESPPTPAPSRLFALHLPLRDPEKKNISVTQFSDFLQSPLYFHLNRSLKWETHPREKREMDALDFGDLAHQSLESWGKNPTRAATTDADLLRGFFEDDLRQRVNQRYGTAWPLGVEVQIAALLQRLGRFAELQVAERAEGWTVRAIEHPFTLPMGDWTIRGKIDRVDVHSDGRVRLLDYKTSEKARSPEEAHLKVFKKRPADHARFPEAAWFEHGGAGAVWQNLQLPLYMAYWRQQHADERLQCGYIQLPSQLEAVSFSLWEGCDDRLESAALACAGAVLRALEDGDRSVFPAAACWKKEPWSVWFPGGPEEALQIEEAAS